MSIFPGITLFLAFLSSLPLSQAQGDEWESTSPREHNVHHRQLQKPAAICAENPSNFATSLYINHVGDGTSFQEADLDTLLQYALLTYNQLAADSCDTTFRTLQSVSVASVFYTEELDFIRLRYDFTGQCDGCVPGDMESGIGPLFGNYENVMATSRQMPPTRKTDPGSRRLRTGGSRFKGRRQLDHSTSASKKIPKGKGGTASTVTTPAATAAPPAPTGAGITIKSTQTGPGTNPGRAPTGTVTTPATVPTGTATVTTPATTPATAPTGSITVTTSATAPSAPLSLQTSGSNSPKITITSTTPPPAARSPTPAPTGKPTDARIIRQQQNPGCACRTDPGPLGPHGPTPSEFAIALNERIAAGRASGVLSGVEYVDDVFEAGIAGQSTVLPAEEARDVSCSRAQDFSTDVWVEFENGQPLNDSEKIPMEVALQATFNEMTLLSCDVPFFRMINDVTFQESRANGSDKIQMRFTVSGKCVNCDPTSLNLFGINAQENPDPAAAISVRGYRAPSRSLLLSEIERVELFKNGPILIVRNIPVSCVCPLNENDVLNLRAPTTREFSTILQDTINTLRTENRITSVQNVVRVAEGQIDGQCSADVITFESIFFADFEGQPELLRDSEIQLLEDGFATTYNDLIYNSCDSYFRSITDVQLIPGESRRRRGLQATGVGNANNASDVLTLQSGAPSVYLVTGQCRGCPVTGAGTFSLMDDAFRVRNLREGGKSSYSFMDVLSNFSRPSSEGSPAVGSRPVQRRLQECECAPGAFPDGPSAPTQEIFRRAYNVKIDQYNNAGTVTSVRSVAQLVEAPPHGIVTVGCSIFYGTLERIGNPTAADYRPLEKETTKFYENGVKAYFENGPAKLVAVSMTRISQSTPRPDLDKLQVPFETEFIFEGNSQLPSSEQLMRIMAGLDYVEYITDHLWALKNNTSVFGKTHSVRFAGRESKVVNVNLLFTVEAGLTSQQPSKEDRSELERQINLFFLNHLRQSGFYVTYFTSFIDAEDISIRGDGLISVKFDARVVFSTVVSRPSQEALETAILNADLDALRSQLSMAPPAGTAIFNKPFRVVFEFES